MVKDKRKTPRCLKFLLFFVLLVVVVGISTYVGLSIAKAFGFGRAEEPSVTASPGDALLGAILSFLLGVFFLGAAGTVYLLTLFSRGLTFNFRKPFLSALKTKMFAVKTIFLLFLALGLGLPISVVTEPLLMLFGISGAFSRTFPIMAVAILYSLSQAWFSVWAPLETSVVKKRLAALGIPEAWIERGIPMGISNPAKSSYKKLTLVEEDIGMLWVTSKAIRYVGDVERFTVRPGELFEIQRAADPGSMSCLGGAVPIVIGFLQNHGSERRVRLYPQGHWTTARAARALDGLEETLIAWQNRIQTEPDPEETPEARPSASAP